jgi:hypothetical protein
VAWQDYTGTTYGQVYFARLDSGGALVAGSLHAVSSGTTGNFPSLLWLGAAGGYALVMQGWSYTTSTYEIYIGFLDADGVLAAPFEQVSDEDAFNSRYPEAAFAPDLGTAGRIGIVWSDARNTSTGHDVYMAVLDLETGALVDTAGDVNHQLTGIVLDEHWPIVTGTATGFLTAVIASTTEQVVTIESSDAGTALAAPTYVTPELTASRPIDVAWDGADEVGLVWRDDREPPLKRIMFRPLDVHGAFAGVLSDGVPVGDALNSTVVPAYYIGEASLAFDALAGAYALAWDAQPGVNGGDPNEAEVFVTLIEGGGGSFDAPFQISTADGRSVMPALAIGGGYLAAWHDNRSTPADTTYAGEIYAAALSCP